MFGKIPDFKDYDSEEEDIHLSDDFFDDLPQDIVISKKKNSEKRDIKSAIKMKAQMRKI